MISGVDAAKKGECEIRDWNQAEEGVGFAMAMLQVDGADGMWAERSGYSLARCPVSAC